MDRTYSFAPARPGIVGVVDKLAQFEAMARVHGGVSRQARIDLGLRRGTADLAFREFVLKRVVGRGLPLEGQLKLWERFVEGLEYIQEPGEVVANPMATVRRGGGDCDDLVIVALAGYYSLGVVDARAQLIAGANGDSRHVRCLVPVPATGSTTHFRVFDPISQSEGRWGHPGQHATTAQVTVDPPEQAKFPWVILGLGLLLGVLGARAWR